jgi:hypothetical protein
LPASAAGYAPPRAARGAVIESECGGHEKAGALTDTGVLLVARAQAPGILQRSAGG